MPQGNLRSRGTQLCQPRLDGTLHSGGGLCQCLGGIDACHLGVVRPIQRTADADNLGCLCAVQHHVGPCVLAQTQPHLRLADVIVQHPRMVVVRHLNHLADIRPCRRHIGLDKRRRGDDDGLVALIEKARIADLWSVCNDIHSVVLYLLGVLNHCHLAFDGGLHGCIVSSLIGKILYSHNIILLHYLSLRQPISAGSLC